MCQEHNLPGTLDDAPLWDAYAISYHMFPVPLLCGEARRAAYSILRRWIEGGLSILCLHAYPLILKIGTHARDHEGTEHGPTSNHTHSKRAAVHAFILGTWGYALQS